MLGALGGVLAGEGISLHFSTYNWLTGLVFAMPLYASVYMCLVVTCWESADLLTIVCGVLL